MKELIFAQCEDSIRWIKRQLDNGQSWDFIRMGGNSSEEELNTWLKFSVQSGYLEQCMLDVNKWYELVDEYREIVITDTATTERAKCSIIHDKTENSDVRVPTGDRSAWQLYRKHLIDDSHFEVSSVDEIEDACFKILKRLSSDTITSGPIKGLVVGNVQSGKTANMAGLMAMAADWGWNIFIVLSGTIENLRVQTQNRLMEDLAQPGSSYSWFPLEKPKAGSGLSLNYVSTTGKYNKVLIVSLKVKNRLQDLLAWLQKDPKRLRQQKILVIDDESDLASINTADVYGENEEYKTINRLIRNLVFCRDKKAKNAEDNKFKGNYQAMDYVCYTATPFANLLNENSAESLFPSNFVCSLKTPPDYIGPDKLFNEDPDSQTLDIIRRITDDEIEVIKGIHSGDCSELPASLIDSLLWFICVAASMRFYEYRHPVSMLIHTSQKQADHAIIDLLIGKWLESHRNDIVPLCRKVYESEIKRQTKKKFLETMVDYPDHHEKPILDYPNFNYIVPYIIELVSSVDRIKLDDEDEVLKYSKSLHVCVDNCSNNGVTPDGSVIRLIYPEDDNELDYAPAFIVIGGNTLSRGLTLKGLVSTYFIRTVSQADALMQMGRWFGYRIGYELFPRVWLTESTEHFFEALTEIDIDLRKKIDDMAALNQSPDEIVLSIKAPPKKKKLTAKNKMQSAVLQGLDYSGVTNQMSVFSNDVSELEHNTSIVNSFIKNLGRGRKSEFKPKSAYVWDDVSFDFIEKGLFVDDPIRIAPSSRAFQNIPDMCSWIREQSVNGYFRNWSVIASGIEPSEDCEEKNWRLAEDIVIGKVNRSKKPTNKTDTINIGALVSRSDCVADLRSQDFGNPDIWNEMKTSSHLNRDFPSYRNIAGKSKTPVLLLYRVYKDSVARISDSREAKTGRVDLNAPCDLTGIAIVLPGIKKQNNKGSYAIPITISIEEGNEI